MKWFRRIWNVVPISISCPAPPGPVQLSGYTEGTILDPSDALSLTCQSCGGFPAQTLKLSANGVTLLAEFSTQDVIECVTISHVIVNVGSKFNNEDNIVCTASNGITVSESLQINVIGDFKDLKHLCNL